MPLFLVAKLVNLKYDPEKFITWYIKFPDISAKYPGLAKFKSKKANFYWFSAYYVWVFYIFACVVIGTFSLVVGLIGIVMSPFITAGYIYAMAYLEQEIKKIIMRSKK